MVCRNAKYAEDAKNEIIQETKNEKVFVHILDLSSPKEIIKFATNFKNNNTEKGLDVLVNNAGCMVNVREETPDEIEKNFATNTLGTYILTEELIPLLQKTSSGKHFHPIYFFKPSRIRHYKPCLLKMEF